MKKRLQVCAFFIVLTLTALLQSTGYCALYEAEDAVIYPSTNGPTILSANDGYTGTGYVDYRNSSGDYVEWTVTLPTTGDRDLYFRYALSSGNRPLEIRVNGQIVASSLSFAATGDWKTWAFTAPLTVTLNAGANTVRATAIGSSGGNVDHLYVLEPGPPSAPANLIVTAGDTDVLLEWDENLEPDFDSYNVYRSTSPGSYGAPYATGVTVNELFDETVTNGTTYYYAVSAVDTDTHESGYSDDKSGTPKAYAFHSLKKGNGMGGKRQVEPLKSSWYYSWGMNPNEYVNPTIEFIPMRFDKYWPNLNNLVNSGDFSALLGYNEPDSVNQGNTTVAEAIAQWPQLEAAATQYGALLGSPATTHYNDAWMVDFMNQAAANDYTVDFMCVHWYYGPNADTLMSNLEWVHTTFGNRDIWLTEFNVADWSAPNDYTIYQSYGFWVEALYRLESTSYIKRYAAFPWDGDTSASEASPFFVPNGNYAELTPLGKLYAEYRSSDTNGPYPQTWYYLQNEHSRMRLRNNADTASVASIYTEDDSVLFELVSAGGGNYYIVNKSNGLRLRCTGNSVEWSSASDTSTQWSLTQAEHCWQYIQNVAYAKRLSSTGTSSPRGTGGTLSVSAASTTDTTVKWVFVRTPDEYLPEILAPSLDIAMSNAFVTVSWAGGFTGWSLEYNTNLIPSNGWVVVPGSESSNRFTAGPMTNGSLFFRLKSP